MCAHVHMYIYIYIYIYICVCVCVCVVVMSAMLHLMQSTVGDVVRGCRLVRKEMKSCIHHSNRYVHTPHFCKRDLIPPDFNGYFAVFYNSSDHCIQSEDDLTRRGRNMQLAGTFVYTLTP